MAGKRGPRPCQLLRRGRQPRRRRAVPYSGDPCMIQGASTPQPAQSSQLGAHGPPGQAVASPCPRCALNLPHGAGDLVSAGVDAGSVSRFPELATFVDRVVVDPQRHQQGGQHGITQRPGRRLVSIGVVVGGGGDLENLADRLDPPSTPTGLRIPVGVVVGDYFVRRRSSSAPKKVAAAWRMSFARRSSLFFLRSVTSSSCSAVVTPCWCPTSMSAYLTQARRDSFPTPSWQATREITPWSPGSACRSSPTIRTARSFNSAG